MGKVKLSCAAPIQPLLSSHSHSCLLLHSRGCIPHFYRELSVYFSSLQSAWISILLKLLQNFWLPLWVVPKAFLHLHPLALDTISEYGRHSQQWEPLLMAGIDQRNWFAPIFGILMKHATKHGEEHRQSPVFVLAHLRTWGLLLCNRLKEGFLWHVMANKGIDKCSSIRLFTRKYASIKKKHEVLQIFFP